MDISDYLENAWLDTLRGNPFSVSAVYMSLHSDDPGEDGANEISGDGYARVQVIFNAPSEGSMAMASPVEFPNMPNVTVTHVGLWDSATGGNFLLRGALSSPVDIPAGFTLRITALTISLD
ncbi:MAG: hypothetical protein RML46_06590 [Anaerolineae bacterium]|nr:hypothetical protein [Anaerolineae bacterium]